MHARFLLPVLLAIELSLHCQMCDLFRKFEEDRTETAVAIEDDMYFGQTDTHTQIYTQVILYLSNVMHCIGQTTSDKQHVLGGAQAMSVVRNSYLGT